MVDISKSKFTKVVVGEPDRGADATVQRKNTPAELTPGSAAQAAVGVHELKLIQRLQAELKLVSEERDRLRRELTSLESMQSDTRALDENWDANATRSDLPSIDDLMKSTGSPDASFVRSHATLQIEEEPEAEGEYQEMISPASIVLGSGRYRRISATERFLVWLDDETHPQFPLDQDLLTIGRSDSADFKISAESISRIHARILRIGMDSVIEDAGSKNGTRINGESIQRHVLVHGDLVQAGSVSLRFVDSAKVLEDTD